MNNNIYIGYKWYVPKEEYDNTEKLMLKQDKTIRELDRKNKELQKENIELHQKVDIQEDIICEAIEYIEHSQNYGTMAQVIPHFKPYVNGDDLLKILKGDSNE